MIRVTPWSGTGLVGRWLVTRKLDGVRAVRGEDGYVSRNGKPLHGLSGFTVGDAEIFCGSWEATISKVRSKNGERVHEREVFSLEPLDGRLLLGEIEDPTAELIQELLAEALEGGDEGLVLRRDAIWLKVKPQETYDVPVMATLPGAGRHSGRIGALVTPMGKVGTGLTDAEREREDWVGKQIEVACQALTPAGKFRHARFVRERFDK